MIPTDPALAARLRVPAERAPHELRMTAWPVCEEAWRGTTNEAARDAHAPTVGAGAAFEPSLLVAHPDRADAEARA